MKSTRARDLIFEILTRADGPVTAEQIYKTVFDSNINLSTIYRNLLTFENEGIIEKDDRQDGKAVYVLKHEEHYHILECLKCHQKIYLDFCPYHDSNKEILKKTGFQVSEHNIVIYGLCPNCQKNKL